MRERSVGAAWGAEVGQYYGRHRECGEVRPAGLQPHTCARFTRADPAPLRPARLPARMHAQLPGMSRAPFAWCRCAGAGCAWEDLEAHPTAAKYGGLPACADASRNLDVGDAHRSYAVWVRQQAQAGRIDGHWFLFPHVGLAVELVDGVAISWDGREIWHSTSAPSQPVQHDDALLSLFFSLPLDVVAAGERRRHMADALVARHASDAYPRWRRDMSVLVWGK
jgi:hypothetical protein